MLITADNREKVNTATVELDELRQAMLPEAAMFFACLLELSPPNRDLCKK